MAHCNFFAQVFLRAWIDGDVFSWKARRARRLEGWPYRRASSRKCVPTFDRFGPVRHRCRRRDFDVGVIILTLV